MIEPSYSEFIRSFPIPTAEQTRGFAEYVAAAHSWYKHLPVYPPQPFYFYLDPNAGRNAVYAPTGEIAFADITDESERFHYTWQPTEQYRRRFGCWNYLASYGTFFIIPSQQGAVDTRQSGHDEERPAIFVPESGWIEVPAELLTAGTAWVTALVHLWRNLGLYWAIIVEGDGGKEVALDAFLKTNTEGLAKDVRETLLAWLAFYSDPAFEELKDTDLNAASQKQTAFRQRQVYPVLDRERERQIAGMEAAMQRFLNTCLR